MRSLLARTAAQAVVVLGVTSAQPSRAGDWTKPVEVRHEADVCVSYRARLSGDYLVVQATLEPGWHTFAMDNKRRAEEKLAGKRLLGIERSTDDVVTNPGQIFHTATAHQHDGVFLQIMAFIGDVGNDFMAIPRVYVEPRGGAATGSQAGSIWTSCA